MSLDLSITVDDQATPVLVKLLDSLSSEGLSDANEVVGRIEVNNLREYHREFEAAEGWSNPSLPTHGAGRKKSRFGEDVANAWQLGDANSEGFTLSNNATGLSHKVTGGTITAKRAKALTIPMVPEAHGVRAGDYPGKLFRPKGKDYLMETDAAGVGRVVYLLRKSVTHKAVKGALPPTEEIASRVAKSLTEILLEDLD